MFNFRKNEVTGQLQTNFPGKLISIGTTILELKNDKKTKYRVATIEFNDANHKAQRVTSLVYESNFAHGMVIGEIYNCTASYDPKQGVLITTSHLPGSGVRADAGMFGFATQNIEANSTPVVQPDASLLK